MAARKAGRKKLDTKVRRGATMRQRRMMRALLQGKSVGQAGLEAGYTPRTVEGRGASLLKGEHWEALLAKAGLDDKTLVEKYLKRLVQGRETRFFHYQGAIQTRRTIAHEATAKGLDIAFRLRDAFPRTGQDDEQQKQGGPVVSIQFLVVQSGTQRAGADNGKDLEGIQFRITQAKKGGER